MYYYELTTAMDSLSLDSSYVSVMWTDLLAAAETAILVRLLLLTPSPDAVAHPYHFFFLGLEYDSVGCHDTITPRNILSRLRPTSPAFQKL